MIPPKVGDLVVVTLSRNCGMPFELIYWIGRIARVIEIDGEHKAKIESVSHGRQIFDFSFLQVIRDPQNLTAPGVTELCERLQATESAARHLVRAAEDAVRSIYANWTNPEHHCAGNRLRMAAEETTRYLNGQRGI